MAPRKALSSAALEAAESAARRLDQWRSTLLKLEATPPSASESEFLGIELRGAAIVAAMAELEHLITECLVLLSYEVNASSTKLSALAAPLRSLAMHSILESLASTTDSDRAWTHRIALTQIVSSGEIVQLPIAVAKRPQPPLDGKTIRPSHLRRVWSVLGLTSDVFPSQDCEASLMRLAGLRNDIAHRNLPISEVFRQPDTSAMHIARYLDDIELLIMHLGAELSAYGASKSYAH